MGDRDGNACGRELHPSEDRATWLARARADELHELDVGDRCTREQRVAVPPAGSGTDDGAVHESVAEPAGDERRLIAKRGAPAPLVDFLQTDEVGVELGTRLDERPMIDGAVDACAMPDVERRDAQHTKLVTVDARRSRTVRVLGRFRRSGARA